MDWPEHLLPLPSENYTASADPALAKTEFEIGFRQRRKFTGIEERVAVNWLVTQFQLDILEAFVQRDLEHGSMAVEMSILGVDGVRRETVRILGGIINKDYVPGNNYRVSATLIVEPKDIADPDIMEWLVYLADGTPDGFIQLAEILALYNQNFYGVSTNSPEVTAFMLLHS